MARGITPIRYQCVENTCIWEHYEVWFIIESVDYRVHKGYWHICKN